MHIVLGIALKILGQALLVALTSLVSGKTFRYLLLLPFVYLSRWTGGQVVEKVVEQAEKDLGLSKSDFPESDSSKKEDSNGK